MIKLVLVYFVLFVIFYAGIPTFLQMTGKQKWDVTKLALYSLLCSFLAIAGMVLILILF